MDHELLGDLFKSLFPPDFKIVAEPDGQPVSERFWLVPGGFGSRWVVPHDPAYGWPVLSQWRPYDKYSLVKWKFLTAMYRSGQLGAVPGVISFGIQMSSRPDWKALAWGKAAGPAIVTHLGTPGQARKASTMLIDKTESKPVSVVKSPLSPLSRAAIMREAQVLLRLAKEKSGVAPALVCVDEKRGLTVQEAVIGSPTGANLTTAHYELLSSLHMAGAATCFDEQVPMLAKRFYLLSAIDREQYAVVATAVNGISGTGQLPAVWRHGDFAPWNIRKVGDKLCLIGWERGASGWPPLGDLFHFHLAQAYLFGKAGHIPERALSANEALGAYVAGLGVSESVYQSLLMFYLAVFIVESIEIGQSARARFFADELQLSISS